MSVAIILPTYCEAENIESLIQEIQDLKLDLSIAVIDDSSPDGTPEIVKKLQDKYDNMLLVARSEKLGLGTAITTGFRSLLGLRKQPDFIVTMDADYSHNPRDIPRLISAAREGHDLVIGSRYYKGGKVIGSTLKRRIISRVANLIAAATIGKRIHDCTSGFRCYSRNYVENVLHELHSQTYEIQIETLRQARLNEFHVKEIPITFVNRKKGKSKLTVAEAQAFLTYVMKMGLSKLSLLAPQVVKNKLGVRIKR
jgi:dolichol-phosphate mannosyltransferase